MLIQVGSHLPEAARQDQSAVRAAVAACGETFQLALLLHSAGSYHLASPPPSFPDTRCQEQRIAWVNMIASMTVLQGASFGEGSRGALILEGEVQA